MKKISIGKNSKTYDLGQDSRIYVFTNQNQTFFPGGKINKKNTGFTYLRIYVFTNQNQTFFQEVKLIKRILKAICNKSVPILNHIFIY